MYVLVVASRGKAIRQYTRRVCDQRNLPQNTLLLPCHHSNSTCNATGSYQLCRICPVNDVPLYHHCFSLVLGFQTSSSSVRILFMHASSLKLGTGTYVKRDELKSFLLFGKRELPGCWRVEIEYICHLEIGRRIYASRAVCLSDRITVSLPPSHQSWLDRG